MRSASLCLSLAVLAGCSSSEPVKKADPAPAAKAEAPKPMPAPKAEAAKAPAPQPKPKPAPVTADLTKAQTPPENAELFGVDGEGRLFFYTGGPVALKVRVPADGDYQVVVNASCDEAMGEKAKFSVAVDGQALGEVTCTTTDPRDYTVKAPGLKAGERTVTITFLNDQYKENEYDLNLYVHGLTLKP